jgi:hypothetical protein
MMEDWQPWPKKNSYVFQVFDKAMTSSKSWSPGFQWAQDGSSNLPLIRSLWENDGLPGLFDSSEFRPVFAAGPSGTGIPIHQHPDAFLQVCFCPHLFNHDCHIFYTIDLRPIGHLWK